MDRLRRLLVTRAARGEIKAETTRLGVREMEERNSSVMRESGKNSGSAWSKKPRKEYRPGKPLEQTVILKLDEGVGPGSTSVRGFLRDGRFAGAVPEFIGNTRLRKEFSGARNGLAVSLYCSPLFIFSSCVALSCLAFFFSP